MKIFENPKIEILTVEVEDIITTSEEIGDIIAIVPAGAEPTEPTAAK